jgi:alkylated DNA repair dioxygenase AlkB
LPLVKYTQKQQNDVADAMDAQPNAEWGRMINDYGKLRKQARAACGKNI